MTGKTRLSEARAPSSPDGQIANRIRTLIVAGSRGARRVLVLAGPARGLVLARGVALEARIEARMVSRATARRKRSLPDGDPERLTVHERQLLEVLAALIIPSDETGPGACEANVVEALDRRTAGSPSLRGLYARGLEGLESCARSRHGLPFGALAPAQRTAILRYMERLSAPDGVRWGGKAAGRLLRLYRVVRFPAAQLVPVLLEDVREAFYTSPVGWQWLGYDGPPMPRGYLDVEQPRV